MPSHRALLITFLLLPICLGHAIPTSNAQRPPTVMDDKVIAFEVLDLGRPVTSLDLSEDGLFLAVSHQGDNLVSIYDIANKKIVHEIEVASPRSILWRSGQVIVANQIEGVISVFTQSRGWKLSGEARLPKPGIKHLAAPSGRFFRGEVIATCHGDGVSASYQDSMIFAVNTRTKAFRPISKSALASVSYDGRLLITQESFNLSPSGGISAFNYSEYVRSGGKARKLFGGGVQQTPYVYQVSPGGYWFGRNIVFAGTPLNQVGEDLNDVIFADVSQKIVYSMTKEIISAHKLGGAVDHISGRRVSFPQSFRDSSKLFYPWAHRDYLLDHPIAVTHGEELFLFFRPPRGSLILAAVTPAFESTGEPISAKSPPAPARADAATPAPINSARGVLPVPPLKDRRARLQEITEIFDIESARSKKQRLDLARRIQKVGLETKDDPVAAFVLLNLAREKAIESGNIAAVAQAIDAMRSVFQFDELEIRAFSIKQLASTGLTSSERKLALAHAKSLLQTALAADQYADAMTLIGLIADISETFGDANTASEMRTLRTETQTRAERHASYLRAMNVLESRPDEPEQRLAAGQFLVFRKRQWRQGFELLRGSSDATLDSIARQELAKPTAAKDQVTLAEAWLAFSDQAGIDDDVRQLALSRAAALFKNAEPNLSGLSQVKAKRRLDAFAEGGIRPLEIE